MRGGAGHAGPARMLFRRFERAPVLTSLPTVDRGGRFAGLLANQAEMRGILRKFGPAAKDEKRGAVRNPVRPSTKRTNPCPRCHGPVRHCGSPVRHRYPSAAPLRATRGGEKAHRPHGKKPVQQHHRVAHFVTQAAGVPGPAGSMYFSQWRPIDPTGLARASRACSARSRAARSVQLFPCAAL